MHPREYLISILSKRGGKKKPLQSPVRPSKRAKLLDRRKGAPLIRFYDLAQVNHQAFDAPAVWEDHPVLKTPSYSTSALAQGSPAVNFAGVVYDIEPFGDADFAAYTDMMFNYPVAEWTRRYRRITAPADSAVHSPAAPNFTTDFRFTLRDDPGGILDNDEEKRVAYRFTDRDVFGTATNDTLKANYLASEASYWDNDRGGAGYSGLTRLESQTPPNACEDGYFGFSTHDKDYYKVTTTRDPDAADVGVLVPSGAVDVFLMPQIGLFLATAHSDDFVTQEVLGPWYQTHPRSLWPRYQGNASATGDGGQWGADADVSAYIDYQRSRDGGQASSWTYTGSGNPANPDNFDYTIAAMEPGTWTGLGRWGLAQCGEYVSAGEYFEGASRNYGGYSTQFQANDDETTIGYGRLLFRGTEPFLVAVIRQGGQFYYVWDISHQTEPFGNVSAGSVQSVSTRFRLSRGLSWGTVPSVRDGTGAGWQIESLGGPDM